MNNSDSNSNSSNFANKRININKKVSDCLKNCELFQNKNSKISGASYSAYETEANYQKSFTEIEKFSKKITETKRKSIDCCIYNQNNDDGLFSAWVFYKYLVHTKNATDKIT